MATPGTIIRTWRPGNPAAHSGGARVALVVTVGRKSCRCLDLGNLGGFSLPVRDVDRAPVVGAPRRGFAARLDRRRKQLKRHGIGHAGALAVQAVRLLRARATEPQGSFDY